MNGNHFENQKSVYVTNATFKRLVKAVERRLVEIPIVEMYRSVWSINLDRVLSHKEAKSLRAHKALLSDPNDWHRFFDFVGDPNFDGALGDLGGGFIFPVRPPSFHVNKECEFMLKDFWNIHPPAEIVARGEQAVKKFKAFCIENKNLVAENRKDVLLLRLKSEFDLKQSIHEVEYSNTGEKKLYSIYAEMNQQELTEEINKNFHECLEIIGRNTSGKMNDKRYHQAEKKWIHERAKDDKELSDYLRSKLNLIYGLRAYYYQESGKDGFHFPTKFLTSFGLRSCKACAGMIAFG